MFFAHLGSIISIVHFISIFITDPINYIYIFLFITQLHNNLELQVSTKVASHQGNHGYFTEKQKQDKMKLENI